MACATLPVGETVAHGRYRAGSREGSWITLIQEPRPGKLIADRLEPGMRQPFGYELTLSSSCGTTHPPDSCSPRLIGSRMSARQRSYRRPVISFSTTKGSE